MRLTIRFRPINGTLLLPINYQRELQGFLYRSIHDIELSYFLHNVGYTKEKRRFKMFTFSRLQGKSRFHSHEKKIEFFDQVTWHVSSLLDSLIVDLARDYLLKSQWELNGQAINIEEAVVKTFDIKESEFYQIRMLSPLTVYSTQENQYGKKQTNFISPFDPIFSDKIEKNFYNKYQAYFKKEPTERVLIRPKKVTQKDKVVTKFKDIIINAWNGTYEIQAPLPYLKFLYDTGIGAKNSQGFGMFEIF